MILPPDIRTVIFDLGGVIVDLSPIKTAKSFSTMASIEVEDVFNFYASYAEFHAYEKGQISDAAFRTFIRKTFLQEASDASIDSSWNAMLLGLPAARLAKLDALKNHFHTIALSNTNAIHLKYIDDYLLTGRSLDTYFHQTYYSHNVKLRKPETDIYKHVLDHSQLKPEQTVFLDDIVENLEAAQKLGIHTIHITHPDQVLELFKSYE